MGFHCDPLHIACRLFVLFALGLPSYYYSTWATHPKSCEVCELHPDVERRIFRDVSYWDNGGITEDVAVSVCRVCELTRRERRLEQQGNGPDAKPGLRLEQPEEDEHMHRRQRRRERRLLHGEGQRAASVEEAAVRARRRVLGAKEDGISGAGAATEETVAANAALPQERRRRQLLADGPQDCNKPQRVLVQNGTVYLTNLVASAHLGPFELIGFLVELYEASQVFRLPDVEFTVWHGDNAPAHTTIKRDRTSTWPFVPPGSNASAAMPAVISWSKWDENAALVVPYSGAFRCPQDSWDALEAQLESLAAVPWSERKEVAFGRWNGFCTHYIPWMTTADGKVMKCPRTHLGTLAAEHPDLLDTYDLGRAKPVPLSHQNQYKYIASTDGWSISSKFDKYLLLGSTVFKAASTRYGFYYDAIRPYVHYVPFMVNTSDDILDAVAWARSHDAEARAVAEAGRRFALRHLNRRARLCYIYRLLSELSKRLRYKPSCSRRGLCVPLVSELRFLAQYPRTAHSCKYSEVLLRYGDDDPAATQPVATSGAFPGAPQAPFGFEELRRLHEEGTAWPRDDLAQPAAA